MRGTIKKPNEALSSIMILVKHAAKELGMDRPPLNTITLGMIRAPKGGNLKLKIKAGEARSMVACFAWILQNTFPPTSSHAEMRMRCVVSFAKMYDELAQWSGVESAAAASSAGRRGLMLYGDLNAEAVLKKGPNSPAWKLYPKMHLLLHILEDQIAVSGNPREAWCYADESEIGAAATVAESVHPKTVQKVVIEKYRLTCK